MLDAILNVVPVIIACYDAGIYWVNRYEFATLVETWLLDKFHPAETE